MSPSPSRSPAVTGDELIGRERQAARTRGSTDSAEGERGARGAGRDEAWREGRGRARVRARQGREAQSGRGLKPINTALQSNGWGWGGQPRGDLDTSH